MRIEGRWWVSFCFLFNDWVGPGLGSVSWAPVYRTLPQVYTYWFVIIDSILSIVFHSIGLREYLFIGWVGEYVSL